MNMNGVPEGVQEILQKSITHQEIYSQQMLAEMMVLQKDRAPTSLCLNLVKDVPDNSHCQYFISSLLTKMNVFVTSCNMYLLVWKQKSMAARLSAPGLCSLHSSPPAHSVQTLHTSCWVLCSPGFILYTFQLCCARTLIWHTGLGLFPNKK